MKMKKHRILQIILIVMEKRITYLKTPGTVITLIIFIFGLGGIRTSLNFRLNKLEEFQQTVNMVEIQKDIQEIKTNIARLTKLMADYTK